MVWENGDWRRLIPARAGNTAVVNVSLWPLAAHPRSRGEHLGLGCGVGVCLGSSPLARGTQGQTGEGNPGTRLIPARAGNTDPC